VWILAPRLPEAEGGALTDSCARRTFDEVARE
jgi:hypothetical protein